MADTSECVVSQSIRVGGVPYQSISNLVLAGLSTQDDTLNSDGGRLYGSFVKSGSNYILTLYKDGAKSESVATATTTAFGLADVVEANGSGLSGTVNLAGYENDDTSILVTALLATDIDLPHRGLDSLCDYDAAVGFAHYHLLAWNYLKSHIISRYKSIIWNSDFIDVAQINGGSGGYDLGRCLNLGTLRECAAHYAFARIAERQATDTTGIWWQKQKDSKAKVNEFLKSLELVFDTNQDRVEDKCRSFGVSKISRA